MRKITYTLIGLVAPLTPVFAAGSSLSGTNKTLAGFVAGLGDMVNSIFFLIFALTVLVFFWGLTLQLINPGNAEHKQKAKDIMVWGIIGMVVMLSVFGIVNIIVATVATTV